MVFSSLIFLFAFLPLSFICYFAAPKSLRNTVLFVFSLIFYAWGEPVYILLMLFSTVVDYTIGRCITAAKLKGNIRRAKGFVALSVAINLSLLGFFKYTDFFIGIFAGLTGLEVSALGLPLPIGISFYTFQTMSYSIDVYRDKAQAQHNMIDFGTYVTMFPQLIAGPIVTYGTVAQQLRGRSETLERFEYGVVRFVTGLGKKVLLANNIGVLWTEISGRDTASLPAAAAWLGIIAFAFQIYFDFSGYSDMAIGLGSMLGFTFNENFNYPYTAVSVTDFWRRWHISLSSWFRDYVYIPLGGNRKGKLTQIRNLIIVWALTGFWHGASLNFLIWGIYYAVLLIAEKLVLGKLLERAPVFIGRLYTLLAVIGGWVIFAFDDASKGLAYFKTMLGIDAVSVFGGDTAYLLLNNALLLVILAAGCTPLAAKGAKRLMRAAERFRLMPIILENTALVSIMLLSVAYIVDASYNPFLYFRF